MCHPDLEVGGLSVLPGTSSTPPLSLLLWLEKRVFDSRVKEFILVACWRVKPPWSHVTGSKHDLEKQLSQLNPSMSGRGLRTVLFCDNCPVDRCPPATRRARAQPNGCSVPDPD